MYLAKLLDHELLVDQWYSLEIRPDVFRDRFERFESENQSPLLDNHRNWRMGKSDRREGPHPDEKRNRLM